MKFIVVFDPEQKNACMLESSHSFIETFPTYEDAKQEAEIWKANGDCKSFGIYVRCSDKRNYLV
jgi:hypothetical protein